MRLKSLRKKPDSMIRTFVAILAVFFLFVHCKEKEQKRPVEDISLENFFEEVRQIDSSLLMLNFSPDTGFYVLQDQLTELHYPRRLPSTVKNKNITWLKEITFQVNGRGEYVERRSYEYWIQDEKVIKLIIVDSMRTDIKTVRYGISGLPVRIVTTDPNTNDSITEIYHYNLDKRLTRIELLDSANKKVQNKDFSYDVHGNLVRMASRNSYTKDYSDNYFLNNKEFSSLVLNIEDNGKVYGAIYTIRDSAGNKAYEEVLSQRTSQPALSKIMYQYNPSGNLEMLDVKVLPQNVKTTFAFAYSKMDSAGVFTERYTYVNTRLVEVVDRKIKYLAQ
jgi:hypothetical protein